MVAVVFISCGCRTDFSLCLCFWMVYGHKHVNPCDCGVCFMGWISIRRAVTMLSRAAAANAKCFSITMRVIQVGKLHSAAYVLQQWTYTSLLVHSVLWISYEHGVDWSKRVMAGSNFFAGKHPLCRRREFFSQYRITSRVDYLSVICGLSLVSVKEMRVQHFQKRHSWDCCSYNSLKLSNT